MARDERLELIKAIEHKRQSKVITYITSDRPNLGAAIGDDAVPILHEHILAIEPSQRGKIDLLVYSRGGDSDVPWAIVSMFREYCKEGSFSVLVPYRAHSAATVIALGADEIVMTRKAELGPIDITLSQGPYNPTEGSTPQRLPISVEDVTGYFDLLDRIGCSRPEEKMRGFEQLTSRVHPLALGTVSRLLEQTQLVALRLLGTRSRPFSEEKNREIVKRLSSEIYSHRHTISRTEAVNHLGLEQVLNAEDVGISDELWALYIQYRQHFGFDVPFAPEQYLISNNLDAHKWPELSIACIESERRLDVFQMDIQMRRLRQIPPQLALNVNIGALPNLNVPSLTLGLPLNELVQVIESTVKSTLQRYIDQAAEQAVSQLLKSLPTAGFERADLNVGWQTK